jgi:hypothetical protein
VSLSTAPPSSRAADAVSSPTNAITPVTSHRRGSIAGEIDGSERWSGGAGRESAAALSAYIAT